MYVGKHVCGKTSEAEASEASEASEDREVLEGARTKIAKFL